MKSKNCHVSPSLRELSGLDNEAYAKAARSMWTIVIFAPMWLEEARDGR